MTTKNTRLYGALPIAALGGAGVGMKALSNHVMDDNTSNLLSKFKNQESIDTEMGHNLTQDPSLANSFRLFKDYAVNGNKLMNSQVMGVDPKHLVHKLRDIAHPYFPTQVPAWDGEASDNHYNAFKAGPLSGFTRYFDELYDSYPRTKGFTGWWNRHVKGEFDPTAFRKHFRDNMNQHVEHETGMKNFIDGTGVNGVPMMSHANTLSPEVQKHVLDTYGDHVVNNGSAEMQNAIKEKAPAVYKSYAKYRDTLINPLQGLQHYTNVAGNDMIGGSAGAGVGALAGHIMTKDPKAHNTNTLLGGLIGGGVGGLATHLMQ